MLEAIPVLMYHSIAPEIEGWAFKYLSIDPEVFEGHVAVLASAGYKSVSLHELYQYVSGSRSLPPKSLVLTFDDGYLDNWVFAFPILRKYGFKATVFVSTDFVNPTNVVHPILENAWHGGYQWKNLTVGGFLNQAEIRNMLASGLIDFQAHCKTHTWYFTGKDIVDFHHPGNGYPWLAWNARPERKHRYLEEDQSDYVPFGSPVYVHEKSLIARRYFPDPDVEKACSEYVYTNGGKSFFEKPDWKRDLLEIVQRAISGSKSDRYETQEERVTRLREEIVLSKKDLERLLDRPVEFLCWPGGSYDQLAVDLAREAGYLAWTLGSRAVSRKRNMPGEDPAWIKRIAVVPWWYYRGRKTCLVDGKFLRLIIEDYKGFAFSGARLKWYKLAKLFQSGLKP
jgi:peptidoglycan/xylan/chitin deacetylase (PgdA/CDA1 family)